jgi:hypothetical protein
MVLSTANMVDDLNVTTKHWRINNDEEKWWIDIDE